MQTTEFNRGWNELKAKDQPKAENDLRIVLGLRSNKSVWHRRVGKIKSNPAECIGIEGVFEKYGVPRSKVWGK